MKTKEVAISSASESNLIEARADPAKTVGILRDQFAGIHHL